VTEEFEPATTPTEGDRVADRPRHGRRSGGSASGPRSARQPELARQVMRRMRNQPKGYER
jgi:hypothetical protein